LLEILYTAAALTIIQTSDKENKSTSKKNEKKKQSYFGEHTDDIISITIQSITGNNDDQKNVMLATGEIGKCPVIHIYSWNPKGKIFQSLSSVKGFHTGGISQLAFSLNGFRLFSVGIDYTVAVYDTEILSKSFGKMVRCKCEIDRYLLLYRSFSPPHSFSLSLYLFQSFCLSHTFTLTHFLSLSLSPLYLPNLYLYLCPSA
jgi:WD40 repeat protein